MTSPSVGTIQTKISIHALREEGDNGMSPKELALKLFLSTPSARRATRNQRATYQSICISIHALREEGDSGSKSLALASFRSDISSVNKVLT